MVRLSKAGVAFYPICRHNRSMSEISPVYGRLFAVALIILTVGLFLLSILGSLSAGWNAALRVAAIILGVCAVILISRYRRRS
jgi:hypothetical protein